MSYLELKETLNILGIKSEEKTINDKVYYSLDDLNMQISCCYNLELSGKIPFDFLCYILEKYPEGIWKEYEIIDEKYAIDDIYKNDTSLEEIDRKWQEERKNTDIVFAEAKERLYKRSNKDKYLESFSIEKTSDAILFLTELKDYYERINNKDKIVETDYKTILNKVINNIIVKSTVTKFKNYYKESNNLGITKEEVMQNIEANKENLDTPFLAERLIRPLLDKFDIAVNPFLRDDVELENPANYLEKVNLEINHFNYPNIKYIEDTCTLKIETKDEYSTTIYANSKANFKYTVFRYLNENGSYIFYSHKFVMHPKDNNTYKENGEIIDFQYSGDWNNPPIQLHYNISGNYVITNSGERKESDANTLLQVCEILDNGTSLANEITLNNMAKQNSKGLIKKQTFV